MGLLDKTNPRATWRGVTREAFIAAAVGTTAYGAVIWWNGWWDDLAIKLTICAGLCGLVGAVWEWQVPENGTEEDP
jgi:hypothetical protein